jgi:hypothetical protein
MSQSSLFRSLITAHRWSLWGALLVGTSLLGGCAVVAVVDVAASAVVGVAGLAVDAAVGTVRIGGKIVGAGADAVLGGDETKKDE